MPIKAKKQFIDVGKDSYEPHVVIKELLIEDPAKLLEVEYK